MTSNNNRHRPRRSSALWTVAIIAAAAALVINMLVIDPAHIGLVIAILVTVSIAVASGARGTSCGRRHAK